MRVDVLLKEIEIKENGSSQKSYGGLMLVNLLPQGDVQAMNPAGRQLDLRDDMRLSLPDDYSRQFELRTTLTGQSWLEVQVISVQDFGYFEGLIKEIVDILAGAIKSKNPLPFGNSLIDKLSDYIKKGSPTLVAVGKSDYFRESDGAQTITVDLVAPNDIYVEIVDIDPITHLPRTAAPGRELALAKNASNGKVTFSVQPA